MTAQKIIIGIVLLLTIGMMGVMAAEVNDSVSNVMNESGGGTSNETPVTNLTVRYDPEILTKLLWSTQVPVIVNVRDTSNIPIISNDTDEEINRKKNLRKDYFLERTILILSNLSTEEFKLKGQYITGKGFYGDLTKPGFDKLIEDTKVSQISYDGVSFLQVSPPDGQRNQAPYEPEIGVELQNTSMVPVIVELFDADTASLDQIISGLSNEDFEFGGELEEARYFRANITLKGLGGLVRDNPNLIKMIYLDEVSLERHRSLPEEEMSPPAEPVPPPAEPTPPPAEEEPEPEVIEEPKGLFSRFFSWLKSLFSKTP